MAKPSLPPAIDRLALLLEALPLPAWLADADGSVRQVNARLTQWLGETPAHGTGKLWFDWCHNDDGERARRELLARANTGSALSAELRLRRHGGEHRWVMVHAADAPAGAVGTPGVMRLFTASDIDDLVRARVDETNRTVQRDEMLDVSVDCIKIIDTAGRVIHMNRSGCTALGVDPEKTGFGMEWLTLLPPEIRARGQRALNRARGGHNARFAGKSVIPGQKPQYWDNILTPVKNEQGETTTILCVSRDVTLQRVAQLRLRVASEVDSLTDLLNRRSLKIRMHRAMTRARQTGGKVGLLLIDLDHFKNVNDTLGHPAGDHLLRVLSRRIKQSLSDTAIIARLGGDEFAVLIENVSDEQQVVQIADQILKQTVAPISYSGRLINGGMSIGGAIYPRDAWDTSVLMSCADTALNNLKAGGRGGIQMFSERMTQAAQHAASQLELARQAIRDQVIEPHYQPKVLLSDGTIVGFEALLRWRSPEGRVRLPGTVAEAFKDYELASGLAHQMHTAILSDMANWREQGLPLLPVSINAAPVEFMRDDFADKLLEKLDAYRIAPELIEVEITEHILLERGAEFVANALRVLKSHGVRVALDDFGTGHSALAHLRDYPVDNVKIDRSFVARMVDEPSILAIVEAVSRLGPALSVDVIAEGIETERQREVLLQAECRFGQGFLFGAAMPAVEVAKRLRDAGSPGALTPHYGRLDGRVRGSTQRRSNYVQAVEVASAAKAERNALPEPTGRSDRATRPSRSTTGGRSTTSSRTITGSRSAATARTGPTIHAEAQPPEPAVGRSRRGRSRE